MHFAKLALYLFMINIITRPTLLKYMDKYPASVVALQEWYYEFRSYSFQNFNQLKQAYGNASLVGDNRVIFNIKGNDFRLIIKMNFAAQAAYILWFGTHNEYDKIDARTVNFKP